MNVVPGAGALGKKMASIPSNIMNVSNTLCVYENLSEAQQLIKMDLRLQ